MGWWSSARLAIWRTEGHSGSLRHGEARGATRVVGVGAARGRSPQIREPVRSATSDAAGVHARRRSTALSLTFRHGQLACGTCRAPAELLAAAGIASAHFAAFVRASQEVT